MAIGWTACEKPSLLRLKTITLGAGVAILAGAALADEPAFNLHLTIHDYGRLVASSRACNLVLNEDRLEQSILDIARTTENLDDEAISRDMDLAVQMQGRRIPGCSQAMTQIARAHLNRDLSNFKHAVDNQ